ncbi:MAG TPA: YafY family protein [Candidatus Elarobacter sp.]|jgi:predicted DNA-binding transcriptional regulator YafY|nr:YafY family protein [Candidatus Elarobacter sp.]
MKASRLLSMLLLLQSAERRTAGELAEALEVSERTVHRDVEALSAAGVPVYAERGVYGGIALAAGYRKALTQFGEDEIRALFISGSNPLVDLGLGVDRERALAKISGALSDVQRKAVAKTQGRIHLDQRRWNQAVQPQEHLAPLRRAVWDDRRVVLRYRDRERKTTERTVDPLGLVAKAGIWYLVARTGGDEYRTFRAERIIGVTATDETFVRPPEFDLDAYWRTWTTSVEESTQRFAVLLAVRREALETVTGYWETHVLGDGSDTPTVSVRVVFPGKDAALHALIAWGAGVRIVEPLEIRDELVARARAAVAHHRAKTAAPRAR